MWRLKKISVVTGRTDEILTMSGSFIGLVEGTGANMDLMVRPSDAQVVTWKALEKTLLKTIEGQIPSPGYHDIEKFYKEEE